MDYRKPINRKSFEEELATDSESVSFIDLDLVNDAMVDERRQLERDSSTVKTAVSSRTITHETSTRDSVKNSAKDSLKEHGQPLPSTPSRKRSRKANQEGAASLWDFIPLKKQTLNLILILAAVVCLALMIMTTFTLYIDMKSNPIDTSFFTQETKAVTEGESHVS